MDRVFVMAKIAEAWDAMDAEKIRFRMSLGKSVLSVVDKALCSKAIELIEHKDEFQFRDNAEQWLQVRELFDEIKIEHEQKKRRKAQNNF